MYTEDVGLWYRKELGWGLVEIPVDSEIGIRGSGLLDFHPDGADRVIVATALSGHRLMTANQRIFAWSGDLDPLDAKT